jgi:uncharacterized protein YbaP (TraB family)
VGRRALQWLLALSLFGGLNAHAAGPVWAIRGAHNTVYLAGSVHLLPANDTALPKAFDRAYADSATLVMELDLGNFDPLEAMTWMMDQGTLPSGTTLRGVLGEPRYQRVSTVAAALGMRMQMLDGLAPWVVGIELTDLAYEHAGFDPEEGVEEQLVRRAKSDHKGTAGLETLEEELGGLVALSREDQVKMLDQTLDDTQQLQGEMQQVLAAWRHGDTQRLSALLAEEYSDFPALYRPLVTERNDRWLPQIEKMLKGDGNVMVVVGALHVVGKGGLLELLRKDGYTAKQLD